MLQPPLFGCRATSLHQTRRQRTAAPRAKPKTLYAPLPVHNLCSPEVNQRNVVLFTFSGTFFIRCFLFSLLWALTTFLYVISLKILGATEVMSLLATSVSFVYLMAWVVLHEEFVGTRVRGTDTRFTTSLPKWKRRLMLGTPNFLA